METGGADICNLPEDCISHVLSLTSPVDTCLSAAVCTTFRSAAASDTVWERFLPPDYPSILSRAVHPVAYSSKKELFFRLSESIPIDDGNVSFSLDKSSGAGFYMLPLDWFSEVAELSSVWWLEVRGNIESGVLAPKTTYAAYLIYKVRRYSEGLGFPYQETIVKLGAQVSRHTVSLQPMVAGTQRNRRRRSLNRSDMLVFSPDAEETKIAARAPQARADGWMEMEMEMGKFYNDEGEDGEVGMSFMEVKGTRKIGVIIQGIEIRPKTGRQKR